MIQRIVVEGVETPETGAIQFADKMGQLAWPGLYLEGRDAIQLARTIEAVHDYLLSLKSDAKSDVAYEAYVKELLRLRHLVLDEVMLDFRLDESENS